MSSECHELNQLVQAANHMPMIDPDNKLYFEAVNAISKALFVINHRFDQTVKSIKDGDQ